MSSNRSSALLVPAAGSGTRLGHSDPKALVPVRGRALLLRTLDALCAAWPFDDVVVAAPPAQLERFTDLVATFGRSARVVAGGATRQRSVAAALDATASGIELVCVHDAARPLVSATTVAAVLDAAARVGAATAAVRPVDSVRVEGEDGLARPVDRKRTWLVQTPQAFAAATLREAHLRAAADAVEVTDDASLGDVYGFPIEVVPGDPDNVKVTRPRDLEWVERALSGRD